MDEQPDFLTGLERSLLGSGRRYTKREVARLTGVSVERSERLWRALGFVDVTDDDVVFTDDDVTALRLLADLVERGVIDQEAEASLARSTGLALARLADWQTSLVRRAAADRDGAVPSEAALVEATGELVPVMERLQSYIWRRHIVAAAGRMLPVPAAESMTAPGVVGFADIVGFTSFSRAVDDVELARFVDRFEATATETVSAHGGRVIKMIGDAVLFVADQPRQAARIALDLVDTAGADDRLPDLRLGLAYGEVLSRLGDVYGPVVNVAARLTSLARPNTALVDRALSAALGEDAAFRLRRLRRVAVRGYARLEPWALTQAD